MDWPKLKHHCTLPLTQCGAVLRKLGHHWERNMDESENYKSEYMLIGSEGLLTFVVHLDSLCLTKPKGGMRTWNLECPQSGDLRLLFLHIETIISCLITCDIFAILLR